MKIERAGLVGALVVGAFAALVVTLQQLHEPGLASDLDQLLVGARALIAGENPYDAVGPGRTFEWDWPLFYPLPAVLLTVPLTIFPLPVARILFSAIGASLFGYAITRKGEFWRLPFCLGAAFLMCLWRAQWSLYLTAAFFLPFAAIFLLAKPNIAVAIGVGARNRRQLTTVVIAGAALALVSLLVRSDWIAHWIGALRASEHFSAPIATPGGFVLLLALLRWRRPEARVFTALCVIPQTPQFYDLVVLMVIPRSLREVNVLTSLTAVLFCVIVALGPAPDFQTLSSHLERAATWIVFLPALVMLLRRPNVSEPDMIDQMTHRSLRQWIESLPRLDVWLLLLNGVFAVAFVWGFLVTRRA